MTISGLSIVIPALNEADNIREAVGQVARGLPPSIPDYEVIVVDDGSTDGTGEIVRVLAVSNPNIRVIRHQENQGKGAALRTGFASASKDWVLFLDADGQIAFTELSAFVPETASSDVIIGYRANRADSLVRRFSSWWYHRLTACTLGLRVRDLNCPFKLFRRDILNHIELRSTGFFIDAELLYRAASQGVRFKELPVTAHPRLKGRSSIMPRHVLETLRELRVVWNRKRKRN